MTSGWIMTFTGRRFQPLNPRLADIDIVDIAHALSNICRYTGHCREFFSVAQHSVLVSRCVRPRYALWGLLHDASEAYICDMARPVKYIPEFAAYREAEANIMRKIAQKFGLVGGEPACVKRADNEMLMAEARDLGMDTKDWGIAEPPAKERVYPWNPNCAEVAFLERFKELI